MNFTIPNQPARLYAGERRVISEALASCPILNGCDREGSFGRALNRINELLGDYGFQLDPVSGDLLLGTNGNRLLPFRRLNHTPDPFHENPRIENCEISFSWECMNRQQPHVRDASRLETIAYLSL